ncbi:Long-chain-alcohol oxidase FAO2 [Paramyrothecium foliicola]|nr:Long-chain-alcohol oxidase FAO2 [Paramyrothecium foliicola]
MRNRNRPLPVVLALPAKGFDVFPITTCVLSPPMALSLEHKPVLTPLPPAPSPDFLSDVQCEVLWALLDGALASIASASSITDKSSQIAVPDADLDNALRTLAGALSEQAPPYTTIKKFLSYRPSEDPGFREDVIRTLSMSAQRQQLAQALGSLTTRVGSLLMTGYWTPIHLQPTSAREAIMKSWASSRIGTFRNLARVMTTLAQKADCMNNPYFDRLLGYTDVPKNWKAGLAYEYNFLQFSSNDEPQVLTTDVVVVGSGCGGGVCAKNLAEAGHDVLVVDKGYYFPPAHLPMTQAAGAQYLYDHGGVYRSEGAGGAALVAGGAWGGGGTVNWSVCLKLQDRTRAEWADAGLPFFKSEQFDESLDRVWEFVGASTDGIRHNHRNQVMLDGCQRLGWQVAVAPQNTAGQDHWCGQCHLGCGSAGKKGPAVSWLPAAGRAGAKFVEGFKVEKVLFEDDGVTANGVEGVWTSRGPKGEVHTPQSERVQRRVIIKAKKIIISAGSLWSPLLLMKSHIQNPQVGQNLHIHPCNFVTAVYQENTEPWEGPIISSYCAEFDNLDEKGYGVKLETTCMVPYTFIATQPWTSSLDAKLQLLKYPRMASFISLTRDRDAGHVFPDPITGGPRLDYVVSDYDRAHTLEGVIALAKICYVTGATEIQAFVDGLDTFVPDRAGAANTKDAAGDETSVPDPEFSDPAFAKWLQRLRRAGNAPPLATWSSAHQMGTCRMSSKEADGVVDEKGRVWGTKNLVVADASVFPGASGVNPMITVMTLADWISRGVVEDLAK